MSIRRTIVMLTVPLFLALALVNGALLYFQEKAELSQALGEQALAAAVTSAEFIALMEDPRGELAKPLRAKALQAAAGHITGLDGLYLVTPGSPPQALVPAARPWSLAGLERPARARALPAKAADGDDRRYVVALAPTARGAFVAARIDAEPMFARMDLIRQMILLVVLIAGIIAAVLTWFVARRIVRELDENHRMIAAIAAGEPVAGDCDLTIREVRDLAGAVRLMDASAQAAAERSRRVIARKAQERSIDSAIAASRATVFAPVEEPLAGTTVAARICGEAPPGSFFALCEDGTRGMVVVGRCSGASPQEAFARAAAAREYLERAMPGLSTDACLAQVRSDHAIEEIHFREWSSPEPPAPGLVALTDSETAAKAADYADRNPDAPPGKLLGEIELLLEPTGVFAAISRR